MNNTSIRKTLNVSNITANVSADAADNYSQHTKLTYEKMLKGAIAGDLYSAQEMHKELARRLADVSARRDEARVAGRKANNPKDKAAAKLDLEASLLNSLILELTGFKDVNGSWFDGILDMMKRGEAIDADLWLEFNDQNVDKVAVTDEEYSTYSLIRLLNKQGAGMFMDVVNNCTVKEVHLSQPGDDEATVKDGYSFTVNGASYILTGEQAFYLINDGELRQNMPFSKLGVLPSTGVPNMDGKTIVTTLDRITGNKADTTRIRVFYADLIDLMVYRVHLYQIDGQKYQAYKDDNDRLARYFGDVNAIINDAWDCEFFMRRLTLEKNANNPKRLEDMRRKDGYFDPAKCDEKALVSIEAWTAFKEQQQSELLAKKATPAAEATTTRQSTTLTAAQRRKAAKASANVTAPSGDEHPF